MIIVRLGFLLSMIESQDLNSGTSESLNLAKAILDPSLATKCGRKEDKIW